LKDLPHTLKKHGGLFYMLSLVEVFHNLQCSNGMNVLFTIFCEATYTLIYVSIVPTPYLNLYHGFIRKGWGCYETKNMYYWVPLECCAGMDNVVVIISKVYLSNTLHIFNHFLRFCHGNFLQYHNVWLVKSSKPSRKKIVSLVSHLIFRQMCWI
jgi:hypothetical protein